MTTRRSPPGGMFDGFVNTTSLDFAEAAPDIFARVGSNGGSYSTDGGTTWTPFVTVPAASQGSGSIAVSADGRRSFGLLRFLGGHDQALALTVARPRRHVDRSGACRRRACPGRAGGRRPS